MKLMFCFVFKYLAALFSCRCLQIACLLFAQEFRRYAVIAEFSATSSTLNHLDGPDDERLDLQPINGTYDFLSNITKDITAKPWDDGRKENRITRSLRLTKCEKIQNTTCFGAKIQYKFTSIQLSNKDNQENSLRKLYQLEATRFVPMCWAVIQPFLCAVYMPKCIRSKEREYVYLPSFEMCRVTLEPCRILYETDFFPQNLRCNEQVFPCKNCTNDVRDMKFNATGQRMAPLVSTESSINHYPDIEGCGLQCKNPMYTDEEHESVHTLIFWGTILCLICNLFVIATFLIHDWKHSKHPAWNLFYISICFLFNWLGWMLQFIPGHRENIVCRRDGTLRYSEPSAGENLACIVPFILVYYFLIAANVWFAIFTYAWYLQTKDRGSIRDRIDKESFYFHFIAWALPFVLTVTIMVLSEVDGNSIIGICFVGYRNRAIRNGLVLVPVAILSFGVSVFFAFKGGMNLNRIKRATNNNDESKKLSSHILGMGIRTMLVVFFILAFFVFDIYEVRNSELWAKSLKEFIICKITESYSGYVSKCRLQNRPSVAVLQLRLLCLFGVNLMIVSWCWTWPALKTWNRFIKKKFGYEHSDDEKFTKPKHRIIADAYAKRMDDVISVSIQNSHTDPAGLNFDMNNLNSVDSDMMGATLTNYLSNIIHRRNAMTMTRVDYNESNPNCTPYANSCGDNNSEFSVSVRHLSVESRRNSVDSQVSQMSVTVSETNYKAFKNAHKTPAGKKRMYTRRSSRRVSNSSIESQPWTKQIKNIKYNRMQTNENTANRRDACTTADINDIHRLLNVTKLNQDAINGNDDASWNDALQTMHDKTDEPSNMLVPLGAHNYQQDASGDSLTESNDQDLSLERMIAFLRNGNDSAFSDGISQKYSPNIVHMPSNIDNQLSTNFNNDKEMSRSNNTCADESHSSFSDQSIDRIDHKSRYDDVGMQDSDYEMTSNMKHLNGNITSKNLSEPIHSEYHRDGDFIESHHLLSSRKSEIPSIVRMDHMSGKHLTESEKMEKLKKLLLPSN